MLHHLIFDKPGVYEPTICPRTILWKRSQDPDPFVGVFVPSVKNASIFAQVLVLDEKGNVCETVMREERK
jgi:hypothetical protein